MIKKVKISELPLCKTLVGLFTIGVDKDNRSVKVGLEFLKTAADNCNAKAALADRAADAANQAAAKVGQGIIDTHDVLQTLAHSDCTLSERVAALEKALVEVLSGKTLISELQVKKLGVWGDNNLVLVGDGAPAKAPDRAGQCYIDTSARALYYATGNESVSDWKNA